MRRPIRDSHQRIQLWPDRAPPLPVRRCKAERGSVPRAGHAKADDIVISNPRHPRRFPRAATLLLAVLSAGALAGCAVFSKFNMVEIHQESAARPQRNPVILIHGFLGSKLRNARTQETVWGGYMNSIRRGRTDGLDLPIDSTDLSQNRDDLVPYAIVLLLRDPRLPAGRPRSPGQSFLRPVPQPGAAGSVRARQSRQISTPPPRHSRQGFSPADSVAAGYLASASSAKVSSETWRRAPCGDRLG